jgi:hypothetical protein
MGIDSIGRKGPLATPPPDVGGATRPAEASRAFQVPSTVAASHAAAVQVPSGPLERLRAGEVDVQGYLDLKVHEATAHLSTLPPIELEALRAALRDRLATDPALVDLVRMATDHVPQSSNED